jgi:saccharopine dehydrogenase-like NADP-dependent oxidoreductase
MESKIMMILGGYGSAGMCISRLLLQETRLNLILASRNSVQATNAAKQLNTEFSGNCVQGMQVDATNAKELREAFKYCDTVLVCVPITATKIGGGIVQAAFEARINYIDINLDEDKQQLLQRLAERIKSSGHYFLTEAGLMPGLPSTMAFLATERFDSFKTLQFGLLERETSGSYGSTVDLLNYAADPAYVYQQGAWRKAPVTTSRKIDFGPGLGKQSCYPMDLYELRSLPDELGLEEVGFYAAGMNPVTDLVLLIWVFLGLYKFDWSLRLGAKLGLWTVKKFTKPPYTTTLSMEAVGKVKKHFEKIDIIGNNRQGAENAKNFLKSPRKPAWRHC